MPRIVISLLFTLLLAISLTSAQDSSSIAGRLAYHANPAGNIDIYIMNADGSGIERLTSDPGNDTSPDWSPDGTQIAFDSNSSSDDTDDSEIHRYTLADGSIRSMTSGEGASADPDWSPDGSLLVIEANYGREQFAMWTLDEGATRLRYISRSDNTHQNPTWSPDGTQIAVSILVNNNYDIYITDANGDVTAQLTDDPALDFAASWSPDGSRIAFESGRDGDSDIYVINADGSNLQQLTSDPGRDRFPAWSPDGTQIAFSSDRDGDFEIFVMNADGSNVQQLTNNDWNDLEPDWEPQPNAVITAPRDTLQPTQTPVPTQVAVVATAAPATTSAVQVASPAPGAAPSERRLSFPPGLPTEDFTSEGGIRFSYPQDWGLTQDLNSVIVSDSESTLSIELFSPVLAERVRALVPGAATPTDILRTLLEFEGISADAFSVDVAGAPAVGAFVVLQERAVLAYLVDLGTTDNNTENFGFVLANAVPIDLLSSADLVAVIANSYGAFITPNEQPASAANAPEPSPTPFVPPPSATPVRPSAADLALTVTAIAQSLATNTPSGPSAADLALTVTAIAQNLAATSAAGQPTRAIVTAAPQASSTPTPDVPCTVSTDVVNGAALRVGPGFNRTIFQYMEVNQPISVTGQNVADDGSRWWQLDKAEALGARRFSVNEIWVRQNDVAATGNCFDVPLAGPPPIVPFATATNEPTATPEFSILPTIGDLTLVPSTPRFCDEPDDLPTSGFATLTGNSDRYALTIRTCMMVTVTVTINSEFIPQIEVSGPFGPIASEAFAQSGVNQLTFNVFPPKFNTNTDYTFVISSASTPVPPSASYTLSIAKSGTP